VAKKRLPGSLGFRNKDPKNSRRNTKVNLALAKKKKQKKKKKKNLIIKKGP